MGFHFKLETLHKYRQFQEDRLQKDFSEAARLLEHASEELNSRIAESRRCEEELHTRMEKGGNFGQTAMYRAYLQCMAQEIADLQCRVQTAEHFCEQLRQALLSAVQKRKTLDRLKEKKIQSYLAALDEEERKFIGEIAISRHVRTRR